MQVVGIKFKPVGNIYDYDAGQIDLKKGDMVLVDTENGLSCGVVSDENKQLESKEPLKKVIRKLNKNDLEQLKINQKKEEEAVLETKKIVREFNLDMKVIDAEYTFDLTKLIINFTADDRVDFRELVKRLAAEFRTRIELRQVGVRDEAKILGGLGPCGRKICCANHLKEFGKVSIKMAKNQGLSLNPSGISGSCGRLLCCLSYEDDFYVEAMSKMPKLNSLVKTPDGEGTVVYNNVLKNQVSVKFAEEEGSYRTVDYALSEIKF